MSSTNSFRVGPCTLWIVVAHARTNGNWFLVISTPLIPFTVNLTVCLVIGTTSFDNNFFELQHSYVQS